MNSSGVEISGPLGADFHLSLDAEHDDRVGELIPPSELAVDMADLDQTSIAFRALANPVLTAIEPQTREWRAAIIPAAGGLGNARSVSRIHSAMPLEDGMFVWGGWGGSVAMIDLTRRMTRRCSRRECFVWC